jgi:hypothetical protein
MGDCAGPSCAVSLSRRVADDPEVERIIEVNHKPAPSLIRHGLEEP